MNYSQLFPTFTRWWGRHTPLSPLGRSAWRTSPWWRGETAESRQQTLWDVLRSAVAHRCNLVTLIQGLADEHRYGYRQRLVRLAERLAAGTSLADALEQTPGALSDRQTLAVRFGSQTGTLHAVLDALGEDRNQRGRHLALQLRHVRGYALVLLATFAAVTAFLTIRILPSFQEIFNDFNLEQPASLATFVRFSQIVFEAGGWCVALVLMALAWGVRWGRWGRFVRRSVWGRVAPPIAKLRAADVLEMLAMAEDAGRPLVGAISTLARYHYDPSVRRKLLFLRNEAEQGADLYQSMADVHLVTSAEARALASAPQSDDRSWTLRALAQNKRERTLRRVARWIDLLQPAVVLTFASLVLLAALAVMTSLIKLVESLA